MNGLDLIHKVKDDLDQCYLEEMVSQANKVMPSGVRWIVYEYQDECYEGIGTAIAQDFDDGFWEVDISHCSCFGPMERNGWEPMKLESFLSIVNPNNALCGHSDDMVKKLVELTSR